MKVRIVQTIAELKAIYGLEKDGRFIEDNIDDPTDECNQFQRKRRDAETLTTIAANSRGDALEIGTSYGHGTYALAINMAHGRIYTVNLLPEQWTKEGALPTHLISIRDIGSYLREMGVKNYEQIYANTLEWEVPQHLANLEYIFIDGDHSEGSVYSDAQKLYDRVKPGGFIMWHDFSPIHRGQFFWIDEVMRGVERFLNDRGIEEEVHHLANSWVGVLRKPLK
jgi:predicted O-methyltransferase YrrM